MTPEQEAVQEINQGVQELLIRSDRCGAIDQRDFAKLVRLLALVAQNTVDAFFFGVSSISTDQGEAAATKSEDAFTLKGEKGIVVKAIEKAIVVSLKMTPFSEFKFVQKGFENQNLEEYESGDIFCGWSNDGSVRYTEAKWTGGSLSNSDNFIPIAITEM